MVEWTNDELGSVWKESVVVEFEALSVHFPRGLRELTKDRGELSYLAPLGSENISAPYFQQCFFRGGGGINPSPQLSQTPRLPVPRQK